ncbi:hypothetical protein ANN_06760 [Periplaneta americana]|uniref:Uncharacterized protein n=1 Tax=Periplaneta americana TaxID=6978 RepID=A0ABQ8TG54_PERAM|nr:hypothetical protein ANN_06760 [Periplaneta americana]
MERMVSETRRQVRSNGRFQDFEEKKKWTPYLRPPDGAAIHEKEAVQEIKRMAWRLPNRTPVDILRNAYRVLVGRPEGNRPLGRPRRIWEDNIKMDLREVGYNDREWINLAQDRDRWRANVRAAMNLRVS